MRSLQNRHFTRARARVKCSLSGGPRPRPSAGRPSLTAAPPAQGLDAEYVRLVKVTHRRTYAVLELDTSGDGVALGAEAGPSVDPDGDGGAGLPDAGELERLAHAERRREARQRLQLLHEQDIERVVSVGGGRGGGGGGGGGGGRGGGGGGRPPPLV